MLIEQAFHHLPEILCGNRYPHQDYESGIVVAFTLAILQELNGRNTSNPLSFIQAEKLYRSRGIFPRSKDKRPLRADLFINLKDMWVANRFLRQYGWKHFNWLEAKFYRNQTQNGQKRGGNNTNNVPGIIEDILRLSVLTFEKPVTKPYFDKGYHSQTSRYFLHVYDSSPTLYLPFRNRPWLKNLVTPGKQNVIINKLEKEVTTVKKAIGNITDLKVTLSVYNQVIEPIYNDNEYSSTYHCILTRIDSVEASITDRKFTLKPDGSLEESRRWAYKDIVGYLASNIRIKEKEVIAIEDTEIDDELEEVEESEINTTGG